MYLDLMGRFILLYTFEQFVLIQHFNINESWNCVVSFVVDIDFVDSWCYWVSKGTLHVVFCTLPFETIVIIGRSSVTTWCCSDQNLLMIWNKGITTMYCKSISWVEVFLCHGSDKYHWVTMNKNMVIFKGEIKTAVRILCTISKLRCWYPI